MENGKGTEMKASGNQRCKQMLLCVILSKRTTKSSNGKFSCEIRPDSNLDLGAKFLLPLIGAMVDTLLDVFLKNTMSYQNIITYQMGFIPFCRIRAQRRDG